MDYGAAEGEEDKDKLVFILLILSLWYFFTRKLAIGLQCPQSTAKATLQKIPIYVLPKKTSPSLTPKY